MNNVYNHAFSNLIHIFIAAIACVFSLVSTDCAYSYNQNPPIGPLVSSHIVCLPSFNIVFIIRLITVELHVLSMWYTYRGLVYS